MHHQPVVRGLHQKNVDRFICACNRQNRSTGVHTHIGWHPDWIRLQPLLAMLGCACSPCRCLRAHTSNVGARFQKKNPSGVVPFISQYSWPFRPISGCSMSFNVQSTMILLYKYEAAASIYQVSARLKTRVSQKPLRIINVQRQSEANRLTKPLSCCPRSPNLHQT